MVLFGADCRRKGDRRCTCLCKCGSKSVYRKIWSTDRNADSRRSRDRVKEIVRSAKEKERPDNDGERCRNEKAGNYNKSHVTGYRQMDTGENKKNDKYQRCGKDRRSITCDRFQSHEWNSKCK